MHILKDKDRYFFYNALTIEDTLQVKEYLFNFDDLGNCWLEDIENFKLPSKIYDVNTDLRTHISNSFNKFDKNLGVLLTGNKGQGKSLEAKLICKEMNLPVIVVNKPIPQDVNFVKFFNDIKQNYVLFVDEFEKLFKEKSGNDEKVDSYHKQEIFLSFMDGVLTNEHKVLFLLTTNDSVNEFFINRPSRIKFLVEYNELSEQLFDLITNDRLVNKDFREDLENNVSLINLNIDLLISIIEDINLFNKPFSEFKNIYNYKFEQYKYEVYYILNGAEKYDGTFNSGKRIKNSDNVINNHHVKRLVKFTKDEIVFSTMRWSEDKKGKEKYEEVYMKLVPYQSMMKNTKLTF